MWRTEGTRVLAIDAHSIEIAEWPRAFAGACARSVRMAIEPDDGEATDDAMRRVAGSAIARFLAAATDDAGRAPVRRLHALVSDRWISLATVRWDSALAHPPSSDAFVHRQFAAAGFDTAPLDPVRVDDETPFGRPRVAVAYPAALMEWLHSLALALHSRLESVMPLEVALGRRLRSSVGGEALALAVVDGERLRFISLKRRDMAVGQSLVEPALAADRWDRLETLWRRQQLRDPALGQAEQLHVVDLDAGPHDAPPPGRGVVAATFAGDGAPRSSAAMLAALAIDPVSSLNGVRPSGRRCAACWLISAACVAGAVVVAASAYRVGTEANALDIARQRQARVQLPAPPARWTAEELGHVRAVNAAIREINLPIGPLLRALQPPRDIDVALLGLVVDPVGTSDRSEQSSQATLKLTAQAATGAEMTRYVAYLADRPRLARAYLLSHSVEEADTVRLYRFTVEVTWRE